MTLQTLYLLINILFLKTDLVAKKEVLNFAENNAVRKILVTLNEATKTGD